MKLQAGYRFRTASRFHNSSSWEDCLCINSGVNPSDPHLSPRSDWRPLTETEKSLLLDEINSIASVEDTAVDRIAESIQTFAIPDYLRSRWWEVAELFTANPVLESRAYQQFVCDVTAFLRFKGLPLPPRCAVEVVLSSVGSVPVPESECPQLARPKTTISDEITQSVATSSKTVAEINLGDDPVSLVFLNLSPTRLAEFLNSPTEDTFATKQTSPPDLVRQFLTANPDYPLIRLTLRAGEGVWLPSAGGHFFRSPEKNQQLEFWLVVRTLE
jgi:hypothetical protein